MTDEDLLEVLNAFDAVIMYVPEEDPDATLWAENAKAHRAARKKLRDYLDSKGFDTTPAVLREMLGL